MQDGRESGCVVDDGAGVGLELWGGSLGEGDCLRRHDVRHGASKHHRAALVDVLAKFAGGKHHAASRSAQSLVGRGGDDVGVCDGVVWAGEAVDLAGDETGEVGHVDHEDGSDLVGYLAEDTEVDSSGVGAVPRQEDERPEGPCVVAYRVVVEQVGLAVDVVGLHLEHGGRGVEAVAVREVSAGVVVHAEHPLVAEGMAKLGPLGV